MNNPQRPRLRRRRCRAAARARGARPAHRCPAELEPRPQPARRRRRGAAGHLGRPLRRQRHRLHRQPPVPAPAAGLLPAGRRHRRCRDENTGALPTNVYLAGRSTATATAGINDVRARFYTGTTVGTDVRRRRPRVWSGAVRAVPSWPAARSSTATRTPPAPTTCTGARSTAVTFGPATAVDPYNDPYWSTIATGSLRNNQPILYRGALPTFYSQLQFRHGDVLPGRPPVLHAQRVVRPVLPGVLGRQRHRRHRRVHRGDLGLQRRRRARSSPATTSTGPAHFTGDLRRVGVGRRRARAVRRRRRRPGPLAGGRDWRSRALFLGPRRRTRRRPRRSPRPAPAGPARSTRRLQPTPTARSPRYAWDFGDGTTGTGATATRTYPPTAPARDPHRDRQRGRDRRRSPSRSTRRRRRPAAGSRLRAAAAGRRADGVRPSR